MREIKFRAWDKHRKAWITEPVGFTMSVVDGKFHIFGFDDTFADMYQVKIELQQYTGLTDRHGVQVYEGDVVQHSESPELKALIRYRGMGFILKRIGRKGIVYIPHKPKNCLEVIGNIYENPELLTINAIDT